MAARVFPAEAVVSTDRELTIEEKIRIARAPICVGILATRGYWHHVPGLAHAGSGARPSAPVFNDAGRIVGTRALMLGDGSGE